MSLFQCEDCGSRENTALCNYWTRDFKDSPQKGKKLCSACDSEIGKWHGEFDRLYLPKGKFKTNEQGNLENIETGLTDCRLYALPDPEEL